MDEIDRAQAEQEALEAFRERRRESRGPVEPGPPECIDCGDDMHPVRRSYGFPRCTGCQTAAEKLRKVYHAGK